jgi:phospholipase C
MIGASVHTFVRFGRGHGGRLPAVEAPRRPDELVRGRGPGDRTRRAFLAEGAGVLAVGAVGPGLLTRRPWWLRAGDPSRPQASQKEALRALGRVTMRLPDSVPAPLIASGTDTMPEVEHVVVLMLENHSYDNFLGMLGRGRGERPRGDGFTLAADGYPTASNRYADGRRLRAFRMPTTCQLDAKPSQEWKASHVQYDDGRGDGFVVSDSGPVAMGYWTRQDLPFTYDLATQFPIGDRWFSSVLGQTDPNRRYLIAATSAGMTDDIGTSPGNGVPDASLPVPANGTIFERLSAAGISWTDYYASFPTGATMELYPTNDAAFSGTNAKPIAQFYTDAAAGSLPSFSLLDPDYGTQSQENPQNIAVGEGLLAQVVHALGSSPAWRKTLLILTYDEHGGYYDHVPPPAALAPDAIAPMVQPGESTYDGFRRYGFRVPAIVVGPYAKRGHVSHTVYDHTSILAFLERKWNLPALTYRDANAHDLTDFLDLGAMAKQQPTFPELPKLAPAGDDPARLACSRTGPGTIPPPPPHGPRPAPIRLEVRRVGVNRRLHGLVVELATSRGALSGLSVELTRRGRAVASKRVAHVSTAAQRVVLRVHRRAPAAGHYELIVRHGSQVLVRRRIVVASRTHSG